MVIYKITNLINGKIYVGQTKCSVEKRFKEHTKANSLIGHAIRKYGIENFKIEVIENCKTFTELNEREIYWIAELNSKVPNGYNIADGGAFYAVSKVNGTFYVIKTDEKGDFIGYYLFEDKLIDKYNDKRYVIDFDETTGVMRGFSPLSKKVLEKADEETGEIKGCFPLKTKNLGKDWLALYQKPALWLAKQKMTGEQSSVLWFLFSQLDFDNYLRVSRADIADALEIDPSRVSRAMKKLKELGIIVEGPPAGKFKTYRLNPDIAHKGKDRNKTIIEFDSIKNNNPTD